MKIVDVPLVPSIASQTASQYLGVQQDAKSSASGQVLGWERSMVMWQLVAFICRQPSSGAKNNKEVVVSFRSCS